MLALMQADADILADRATRCCQPMLTGRHWHARYAAPGQPSAAGWFRSGLEPVLGRLTAAGSPLSGGLAEKWYRTGLGTIVAGVSNRRE